MPTQSNNEIAVFGGGCFWCTEAIFQMLKGVVSVTSGYAGGATQNPTYEEVASGVTGHAEVVRLEYNPNIITYRDLLTVFFASHDPTSLNQQGNDIGTQYRSVIFYTTENQKNIAENIIQEINSSHPDGGIVITEVKAFDTFYPAEAYHKNYYAQNSEKPYCQLIINPKLEKIQNEFAALLKKNETKE
jgi:peptide-methionine (S)-S-oxide reductase